MESAWLEAMQTRASLGFLLESAFQEVFRRQIIIDFSFCDGWFCHDESYTKVTAEDTERLTLCMQTLLSESSVVETTMPRAEALAKLEARGSSEKLSLLKIWLVDPLPIVRLELIGGGEYKGGVYWDFRYRLHETNSSKLLSGFELMPYQSGLLIRFPNVLLTIARRGIPPFVDRPRLFTAAIEHEKWGGVLGCSSFAELNRRVFSGDIRELLWVAEGLHEKRISEIVSSMLAASSTERIRVVCVSGPSSSGKATVARRIGVQLRVNGFPSVVMSMDDFYRSPDEVSTLPSGRKDYESMESVDIALICSRIAALVKGEAVPSRRYDFIAGTGCDSEKKGLKLPSDGFVILEGMHALNPSFSSYLAQTLGTITARPHLVFVSTVTQLNVDYTHHFSTSDHRLLRRILRDYRCRGYSAADTIDKWTSVRACEERMIFPFQEFAEYFVNTSLLYELPILANYVKPLLAEVKGSAFVEGEADRLLLLLNLLYPITEEFVPGNSVLREFCGKGALV